MFLWKLTYKNVGSHLDSDINNNDNNDSDIHKNIQIYIKLTQDKNHLIHLKRNLGELKSKILY